MSFFCKILGHKWKYNFTIYPSKRICTYCCLKQKSSFNPNFKHPLKDDLFIWNDEKII